MSSTPDVQLMQLLRYAPLEGAAAEAAAAFDLDVLAANAQAARIPSTSRLLLSRLSSIDASCVHDVITAARETVPVDELRDAVASDMRARTQESGFDLLNSSQRLKALKKWTPTMAPLAFRLALGLPAAELEELAEINDTAPHPATLVAAVSDDVPVDLAARLFCDTAVDSRKSRWWAPMLAAHMLLDRPGVIAHLADNQWASRPLEAVELAHLLCGPIASEDLEVVSDLLRRDITSERLEAASEWDQRILFWYVLSSLYAPTEVRTAARAWALSTNHADFPHAKDSWFDDAAPLLLQRLESGGQPFVNSPNGTSAPPEGMYLRHPGGLALDTQSWSLSDADWPVAAAALKVLYWSQVHKVTGYQAIRIFWPEKLLGLFSNLFTGDTVSELRRALSVNIPSPVTPEPLYRQICGGEETPSWTPHSPVPVDVVVDAYERLAQMLANNSDAWMDAFNLAWEANLTLVEAAAVVADV